MVIFPFFSIIMFVFGGVYTMGPPKPTCLEVFMVNKLVFRWPTPLFFMVLGAHGMIMLWLIAKSSFPFPCWQQNQRPRPTIIGPRDANCILWMVSSRMCFSERYSLRFDLGKLTLLNLSVKIPFKISYFMRHLVKTFCAFQLFIQRPLEESYIYEL